MGQAESSHSYYDNGGGPEPPISVTSGMSAPLVPVSTFASAPVQASAPHMVGVGRTPPVGSRALDPDPRDGDLTEAEQIELLRGQLIRIRELMERHDRAADIRQHIIAAAAADAASSKAAAAAAAAAAVSVAATAAVECAHPHHSNKRICIGKSPSARSSSSSAAGYSSACRVPLNGHSSHLAPPAVFDGGFGTAPQTRNFLTAEPNHMFEGNETFQAIRDYQHESDAERHTYHQQTTLVQSENAFEHGIASDSAAFFPDHQQDAAPPSTVFNSDFASLYAANARVDTGLPLRPGVPTRRHMSKVFLSNYIDSDILMRLNTFLGGDHRRLRRALAALLDILEEDESRELLDRFAQMAVRHTTPIVFETFVINKSPLAPDEDDEDGVARIRFHIALHSSTKGGVKRKSLYGNGDSSSDLPPTTPCVRLPPPSSASSAVDCVKFKLRYSVNRAYEALLGHTQVDIVPIVDLGHESVVFSFVRSDHTAAVHRLLLRLVGEPTTINTGKL